jgi:hypothetical protein
MKERIEVGTQSPMDILLIELMAREAGNDFIEHFHLEYGPGKPPSVEVEMTINGISVSVKDELKKLIRQLEDRFEQAVLERAQELVSASRLENLRQALDEAEWKIREELRRVQEQS